jgi:hypothetical protein
MTHHRVENGRREFLVTVAGGIAGLAVGSLPARVLAQPAGGPSLLEYFAYLIERKSGHLRAGCHG